MQRLLTLAIATGSLLAALVTSTPVAFAEVIEMDLATLVSRADAVVEVKVEGTQSRRGGRGEGIEKAAIVTDNDLHVARVLKGERAQAVTLTQPGGALGDQALVVSELPSFSAGERAILFLNEQGGVVGGHQGKLRIVGGEVPDLGVSVAEARKLIGAVIRGEEPVVRTFGTSGTLDMLPLVERSVSGAQTTTFEIADESSADSETTLGSLVTASTASPQITSITPSGRNAGTGETVTIAGTGFGSSQGTGKVQFVHGLYLNGTRISATRILSWSDTSITAEVPRRAASGPVVVTNGAGVSTPAVSYAVGFSTGGLKAGSIPFTYRINENTSDTVGEAAAIRAAMETWNAAGSALQFGYGGTSSAVTNPPGASDRVNNIYFASSGFTDSGILAWNSYWYSGSNIVDSDIVFNDAYSWAVGAVSGRFDIESTALHELGHTVGLDDQYPNTDKAMGAGMAGRTRRSLSLAELDGARYLHGATGDIEAPSIPAISSGTHPDAIWYADDAPSFSFTATDDTGVTGYSYVLDTSTSTVPDTVSEGAGVTKSYSDVSDGYRWFHVRARDAAGNWGPAGHYLARIDCTAPNTGHNAVADYTAAASIDLAPYDERSGVASTSWTLNGVPGSGTRIEVTEPGSYSLSFSSRDIVGNQEAISTVAFTVRPAPVPDPVSTEGVAVGTGAPVTVAVAAEPRAGDSDAVGRFTFDSVSSAGRLVLGRSAAVPVSGWRVFGSTWHPEFSGEAAGGVSVTLPYDPLLTPWRASGLRVLSFTGDSWKTLSPTVNTSAKTLTVRLGDLGPLLVAESSSVSRSSIVSVDSASKLKPKYGAKARIVVRMVDRGGSPMSGRVITLKDAAGRTVATLAPSSTVAGQYAGYAPVVRSRTTFTAFFKGDSANWAGGRSVVVTPRAYLAVTKAPSTVKPRQKFYVYGKIKPAHNGAVVKVQAWKKTSSGRYKYVKTVKVTTSSKYLKAKFSLPKGKYRFRLKHSDATHSASKSGWRYVRVR